MWTGPTKSPCGRPCPQRVREKGGRIQAERLAIRPNVKSQGDLPLCVITAPFARCRDELFNDEQFRELEEHLVLHPAGGALISGGGGLRKIRWSGSGRGKRSGVRVIYYFRSKTNRLFLIFGFRKNQYEDLTQAQIKNLAGIIEQF